MRSIDQFPCKQFLYSHDMFGCYQTGILSLTFTDDPIMKKNTGFIILIILVSISANAQLLPYPQSPLIKGINFHWSSHIRLASGSDNWPVTWAGDGNQYVVWSDGFGFGGT